MKGLIRYFVNNPLLVKVFLIGIFIAGTVSFLTLERESLPKVDFSVVIIQTVYPGASPLDVELNISKKIEEELDGIDGLDRYLSSSSESFSNVVVWIDIDYKDINQVKQDIQKAVDRASTKFPEKAGRAEVTELKSANVPITRYIITSNQLKENQLRVITKNLEDQLKDVPGVGKISRIAYRDQEIRVSGDLRKMKYNNISLQDMISAIKNYNVRLGGGNIESMIKEKNIITVSEFKKLDEIENLIIRTNFNEMSVKVKDVASVSEGFSTREIYARGNENNGIILEILKKEGKDIIKTSDLIAEKVKEFINRLNPNEKNLVQIYAVGDITKSTRKLLDASYSNAWQGFLLVFFVLILFLDFKSAFWVAFGIPFSVVVTFLGMAFFGFTINNIALFGLIIVIGMLVDNGIVTAENIHQKREAGLTGAKAAFMGAYEVFAPVASSTLTTVAAFLPLVFLGGITGKFVYQLPVIVIIALMASLIQSYLVLPSNVRKDPKPNEKRHQEREWFIPVKNFYKKLLYRLISHKYKLVSFFILMFIFSIFLLTKLDIVLFSNKDNDIINIQIEGPEGLTLEEMFQRVKKYEEMIIKEVPYKIEIDSLATIVGNSAFSVIEGGRKGNNWAAVRLFLVPYDNRSRTASEIVNRIRKMNLQKGYFKDLQIREQAGGPPIGSPVEVKIISNNDILRDDIGNRMESFLKKQPGVFSLNNDSKNTTEEIRIKLNINQMYKLGINPFIVASTIRAAYEGEEASSIVTQDEDIHIVVTLKEEYKREIHSLKDILIPSSYKKLIPLSSIADFPAGESQNSILRYNGKRTITLTSELNLKENTSTKVISALMKEFQKEIEQHPDLKIKIGGESEQTEESFKAGSYAFLVAIIFIFLILLLEFKSISQPIIVLAALPFGLIGVVFAFYIHSEPIGFFAVIGWVGLAGVVVNNAIVLIDIVNKKKKEQIESTHEEAVREIAEAASTRLRPIMLTTITTVFGLIPSIYGWGGSVYILRPVTMALAYGLLFGMFLTLVLVPCLYLIDFDIKQWIKKLRDKIKKKFLT